MGSSASKIRLRGDTLAWRAGAPGPVVFTNGVFDLLHAGHVSLLEQAADLGASLIVGVNTDASVRRLGKGPDRPLIGELDRARLVAALGCVDCVVLFDEPTPAALIELLLPDLLVKGGDYRPDAVVGADIVRRNGGRVELIPLLPDRSTTRILERLRASS
jgi:D-beta-D-heptose 7-phosphate kinase/D-beta-D-heptose 1-phosphate adenosyltransferase